MNFDTLSLPLSPDVHAPDGSDVRVLVKLDGGSMIHVELEAGAVSLAIAHRTVEELWYFISGRGEFWRRQADRDETVLVEPGVSLSIPVGTAFQFRNPGPEPLIAIAVTMPPWPGMDEAYEVPGPWQSTLRD